MVTRHFRRRRTTMFRKTILALVAVALAAPFALSVSADAKPNGPQNINGPKFFPKPYPHPKPFPKPYPKPWPPQVYPKYPKPHIRPVIIVEQPVVQQVSRPVVRPVIVAAPPPKNCLTKEYTPEGMLTFKDLCTNEMASTPIPGTPAAAAAIQQQTQQAPQTDGTSSEAPTSNNFAGKSYEDFMASLRSGQGPANIETQPTAKN
jgi:hypothetical protein